MAGDLTCPLSVVVTDPEGNDPSLVRCDKLLYVVTRTAREVGADGATWGEAINQRQLECGMGHVLLVTEDENVGLPDEHVKRIATNPVDVDDA
jgi:hypothetical protein